MKRSLLALLLAAFAHGAAACPICLQGMGPTEAQQLALAHRAVLAVATSGGTFDVIAAVRGDAASGAVSLDGNYAPGTTLLAILPTPSARWLVVGPVAPAHAEVLRRIVATTPHDRATDAQWAQYAAFLVPSLRDDDPLLARIAFGELARAPYAALRTLQPMVDASWARSGLDDPSRQALSTLLYGISGAPGGAEEIERRVSDAQRARDATNLAALLAADLEYRGPARVSWIEKTYFADRTRTLAEIEAALLALTAHGDADATVSRARVIAAYRVFMKERKPMAALVARQLAQWGYWDAGPEYAQLLKSGALPDPASRIAAYAYLAGSPRADAQAAARAIASTRSP